MNPNSCLFCGMFSELFTQAFGTGNGGFARLAFDALLSPANALARIAATFLVVWTMLQFMLYEDASREVLKRSLKLVGILIGVGFFYSAGGGTWLFETIIIGMQKIGLGAADKVVTAGMQACTAVTTGAKGGGGTYEGLWAGVECVAFSPVRLAAENWAKLSGPVGIVTGLGDWLAWLILAAPYMFVLGVFGAFLVQSMFYFLAVAGAAPVILLFLVFDSTRGIVWSALKLLLTGTLTIVFAGMAMGFTGFVLKKYAGEVANFQAYTTATSFSQCYESEVKSLKDKGINPYADAWKNENTITQITKLCKDRVGEAEKTKEVLESDKVCSAEHFVCTKSYWSAFLIGLISILLHLLAPRIAANLSGASDSAATAAAVVAGGQFAAAKALGWGKNSAGYGLGLGGRLKDLALGGGALGGLMQSTSNLFGGGAAREAVQQQRMMDSLNQLSLGINKLNASVSNLGKSSQSGGS